MEEDRGGLFKRGQEGLGPERPYLRRCNDEGTKRPVFIQSAQARRQGAKEVWGDGDIVAGGGRLDRDHGHDRSIVTLSVLSCQFSADML
jgi:hypothetical protein